MRTRMQHGMLAAALLAFSCGAAAGGSTINPTAPSQSSGLSSSVVRNNFAAAYNDVNNILGGFQGTTAPSTPTVFQDWLDTSSSPATWKKRYLSGWGSIGTFNLTTGAFSVLGAGSGTVTSVALSMPGILSVSGSPITTSGTFAVSLVTQSANLVFAGPTTGSAAAPTFRSMVAADLPASVPLKNAANIFTAGPQAINLNASSLPTALTGTLLQLSQIDGTAARAELNAYGAQAFYTSVGWGGTKASPTALASGTQIGGYNSYGYNGSSVVGPVGTFRCFAAETWTSAPHQGSYCEIATTANGGSTLAAVMRWENDGGVTVGPSVTGGSKGAGTINAAGLYVNGVAVGGSGTPCTTTALSLQYNSAGAFGCVSGWTTNGTTALTGGASTTIAIGAGTAITSSGPGGALTALAFTSPGTGIATALGVNVGSAGAPVLFNGAGGTPSSLTLTNATGLPVAGGGTGLSSGTSGGVLAFTASGTLASSAALTANLPVIGGGAGAAPSVGTRSGNTTQFVTTTGTLTSGDCVKIDASGNFIANGSACGGGSSTITANSTLTSGLTAGQILYSDGTKVQAGAATLSGNNLTINSTGILKLGTQGIYFDAGGSYELYQNSSTDIDFYMGGHFFVLDGVGGGKTASFTRATRLGWSSTPASDGTIDAMWTSPVAASIQQGAADAATAVAQTYRFQSIVAGTSNVSGANATIIGSLSTGSGISGDLILQTGGTGAGATAQNTATTAMTIKGATQQVNFAGQINVAAMTQTSVAQSGTVCYNSGTGAVTYDSTVGCLTSTMAAKKNWRNIPPQEALAIVLQMRAGSFEYKDGLGLVAGEQVGLSAQQIETVDDRLVGHWPNGELSGVRYQQASALYPMAIQALKADNDNLRAANDNLRIEVDTLKRKVNSR